MAIIIVGGPVEPLYKDTPELRTPASISGTLFSVPFVYLTPEMRTLLSDILLCPNGIRFRGFHCTSEVNE